MRCTFLAICQAARLGHQWHLFCSEIMLGSLENLLLGSFAIVCLCSCLAFGSGGAFQITSGFPQESRSQFISVAF